MNLSDLAAMGASPAWALLALTLPSTLGARSAAFVDGFVEGFAQLAQAHRRGPGRRRHHRGRIEPQRRRPRLRAAGQGVAAQRGAGRAMRCWSPVRWATPPPDCACWRPAADAEDEKRRVALRARLHRPQPRVAAGLALRDRARACIDVSDGLLADLGHITAASGVGAELEAALLPLSSALLGAVDEALARDFALSGGDDYELCFTVPIGARRPRCRPTSPGSAAARPGSAASSKARACGCAAATVPGWRSSGTAGIISPTRRPLERSLYRTMADKKNLTPPSVAC